ncbi:hypothetical protein [Lysobacter gummosus]|uniref:Secreted protein n=1 Tax=Lysobacter gummosus TaxID=262324 RepID=A0ABY3XE57_9GAMM|nr:hypothetical protein [Lysobacter gummosus]ALN94229.1 hypothetical protein LG3211_5297 [Lysobacter gummosus]UNP29637.1 hypothetical protein MOV92_24825 [Lysobacter gummosus]
MRPSLAAVLALALLAAAAHSEAAPRTHYFELINRAHDRLTSVAVAAAGSEAFAEKPLGAALDGGGDSATLQIAGDECRYDFRFVFANERAVIYPAIDVCRYRSLRIQPLPAQERARSAKTE